MSYFNNFIQHGDHVSCKINGDQITGRIDIINGNRMYVVYGGESETWFIGYQDCPQLMAVGITDFRIIKRVDNTPVFMVKDLIENKDGDRMEVLVVFGDSFLISLVGAHEVANGWFTFKEAQKNDWTLVTEKKCQGHECCTK